MKKLLIFSCILLTGCVEPNVGMPATSENDSTRMKRIQVGFSAIDLRVVLIDSCEYLYGPWGNATVLTHKGNCKNPVHK